MISLILQGSAARGESREFSDLDFYIFARNLPVDQVQRGIYLNKLLSRMGCSRRLTLRGKEVSELTEVYPLFLDLAADGIIIYDPSNFARDYLEKIKKEIEKVGLIRYRTSSGYYGWNTKRPLKIGERIVIEIE